jgi:hypothetical protein
LHVNRPAAEIIVFGGKRSGLDTNARSIAEAKAENVINSVLHAMDYTVYAELQLGRDVEAEAVTNEASGLFKADFVSMYAHAAIPARYPWSAVNGRKPHPCLTRPTASTHILKR